MHMKNLVTVILVATLVGCSGEDFSSAPDLSPEVEAGVDAPPEVDAVPDAFAEAESDILPEAAPETGPDTEPDVLAEAAPDAEPDVAIEAAPDVIEPEAGPDAEPDAPIEAAPETGPDAPVEAAPETGADAPVEAAPDVLVEVGPDAEPDAGCTTGWRCDGMQPQQCNGTAWENHGGVCLYDCYANSSTAGCRPNDPDRFEGPIDEMIPAYAVRIVYKKDTQTNLFWRYTPVVSEMYDHADAYTTGTYYEGAEFCPDASNAGAIGAWDLPTQSQFEGILTQSYPLMDNPYLVNSAIFWIAHPPMSPMCVWTRDAAGPGKFIAIWAPDARAIATNANTLCTFWCVR